VGDENPGVDVVDIVSRALAASHEAAGVLLIPTILLDRDQLGEGVKRARGPHLVDYVAGWFLAHGFHAARSSVGIGQGYGAIINEIQDWYGSTIATLRSRQKIKLSERTASLEKLNIPVAERSALEEADNWLFEEKLALRQILSEEQCEACYNAIFPSYTDEDGTWVADFREGAGAPDLFVWHPDPSLKLWFFCEVKSHNDSLRTTQRDWLQSFWKQIEGRFIICLLSP
jgi:VRR-NUC domain